MTENSILNLGIYMWFPPSTENAYIMYSIKICFCMLFGLMIFCIMLKPTFSDYSEFIS